MDTSSFVFTKRRPSPARFGRALGARYLVALLHRVAGIALATPRETVNGSLVADDGHRTVIYALRMRKDASVTAHFVSTVSAAHLALAMRSTGSMGIREKEQVCDRIFAAQPNFLGSVLALSKLGVSMPTIDVVLNILIVLHLAIENSGQVLAAVSEADQELELQQFTAGVRLTEGLAGNAVGRSIKQTTAYKRQKYLLAYVLDTLQRTGLGDVHGEAAKYPILVAVNLVNCIATSQRTKL